MTDEARFCPHCGTRRIGFFRFCLSCRFDFDQLLPAASRRPADPSAPAPTRSLVPRPNEMLAAAFQPTTRTPVQPTPAPAAPAATASPAAATATATVAAPPIAPPTPAREPAVWPPPGALPAEELEGAAARVATPTTVTIGEIGRSALARRVAAGEATALPRRTRASTLVLRRPDLTLTRVAIVLLAGLLAFSAVSNFVRSSTSASRATAPSGGVGSPLTGSSPSAGGGAVTTEPSTEFGPIGITEYAVVSSVVDGDTIRVEMDGVEYPVRLIGIDAPEPDATDPAIKQLADRATATVAQLIEGRDVHLEREVSDVDRFGRLLRDVWFIDSAGSTVLLNIELVRLGFAQLSTFPPDVRYKSQLEVAQQMAVDDGVGLWGLNTPPTPEAPGAPDASATPQTLVGDGSAACHPSYDPCLPIVADLDCAQVRAMDAAPVTVKGPDDYMLDAEEDGLGCESDE